MYIKQEKKFREKERFVQPVIIQLLFSFHFVLPTN
jgi:hypothetical protein